MGSREASARLQILEQMAETDMNSASFHFAINSLIEKGFVSVAGFERCGTGYGRTYAAQKNEEDFILTMFKETRPKGIAPRNAANLMLALVKDAPIDEATISELEDMLAQRRKSIQAQEDNGKIKAEE